jgi:hypothetical protein
VEKSFRKKLRTCRLTDYWRWYIYISLCFSIHWFNCGHYTDCLLKQVIEGKIKGQIEVIRRRERRRKQLLDDLGDRRGYSHLKEEALDRIKWRNRFGRGCGPVVWQITIITDSEAQPASRLLATRGSVPTIKPTWGVRMITTAIWICCWDYECTELHLHSLLWNHGVHRYNYLAGVKLKALWVLLLLLITGVSAI